MIDKTDNIYYKLADHESYTRHGKSGETLWTPGVEHVATGGGVKLCTIDVIHAYRHPLLAAFLNPVHGDFRSPILWEACGSKVVADDSLKIGVKRLTVKLRLELPVFTTKQSVTAAIRIALELTGEWDGKTSFAAWAAGWISDKDRSEAAAEAAAKAARDARATRIAAWAAGATAEIADDDARAAWNAETAVRAAEAAARTARVAEAADEAAWTAAGAARTAKAADFPVFTSALVKILEEVYAGK